MSKGFGRTVWMALGLMAFMSLACVEEGSSQVLAVGGHATLNQDIGDESLWGWGVRGQVGLPLTGIKVQGILDFLSPECPSGDCDLKELTVNLLWTLPIPLLAKPYLGVGVVIQNSDGEWDLGDQTDYGGNVLAGIVLAGPTFPRFQPFGEVRYRFMDEFDSQTVFSFGIQVVLF
jgi:hypothetical protein